MRIDLRSSHCIYCGDLASTTEHWPPQSFTSQGYLFSACKECNNIAGVLYPTDFAKRSYYVNCRLRVKYKKYLNMPDWKGEELRELGYSLRTKVKEWRDVSLVGKRRVAWSAAKYLARIGHISVFAATFVDKRLTGEGLENSLKERSPVRLQGTIEDLGL